MSTLTRRLIPLLAILIAATAVVAAQSGRRDKSKSSVPVNSPTPAATETPAKPKTETRLQLLVAIDHLGAFDRTHIQVLTIVLDTCVRRLAEAPGVKATPANERMNRGDAVRAAKAEAATYVVWLQVGNERNDYGAEVSNQSNQLYVTYTIFEPGTAKIKKSGRAQYSTAKSGPVGISRGAVYSDYAIRETARQAADKILNAFEINIDGWPR